MKEIAAIACIVSLLLCCCTPNKPVTQIPVVGEAIDSAAIAQDTIQQKSIESSYEYAQTVVVSPTLVYDVRAYGGPASHGEYAILRRGADNKADTVVMAERFGTIVNAFTGDLNINGKEEIYIVMKKAFRGASCYVAGYEFDSKGKSKPVLTGDSTLTNAINAPFPTNSGSNLSDTIYRRDNFLVKAYILGNHEKLKYRYKLQANKLVRVDN